MNPDQDETKPESPGEKKEWTPTDHRPKSGVEIFVMLLTGIAMIFGVLVLFVLGTCFFG